MRPPQSGSSPINIVICGSTPVSWVFIQKLASIKSHLNFLGYWDFVQTQPDPFLIGLNLKRLTGTFDSLLVDPDIDVLFICFAPQVQLKLLTRSKCLEKLNATAPQVDSATLKRQYPAVILIPPFTPSYNLTSLSVASSRFIGFAMPLRKLTPVTLLHWHLRKLTESCPLKTVRNPSSLPSYWTSGEVHSFHAHLCAINPVKPGQYSWLCEPGIQGGGLLNVYGAGLIDLAFLLTGGMRISALSSICRTFDRTACGSSMGIRRVSGEDYVLVTAELEASSNGTTTTTTTTPVVMFSISSDMPRISSTEDCSTTSSTDQFRLHVELSGSLGKFVIPPSGDKISWTSTRPLSKVRGSLGMEEDGMKPNGGLSNHSNGAANQNGTRVTETNGTGLHNGDSRPTHELKGDYRTKIVSNDVKVERENGYSETAYFSCMSQTPPVVLLVLVTFLCPSISIGAFVIFLFGFIAWYTQAGD